LGAFVCKGKRRKLCCNLWKATKLSQLQASFKNTQQLKDFVNNGGEWLNFSLFEDNGGSAHNADNAHNQAKQDGYQPSNAPLDLDEDSIPF